MYFGKKNFVSNFIVHNIQISMLNQDIPDIFFFVVVCFYKFVMNILGHFQPKGKHLAVKIGIQHVWDVNDVVKRWLLADMPLGMTSHIATLRAMLHSSDHQVWILNWVFFKWRINLKDFYIRQFVFCSLGYGAGGSSFKYDTK